jgi:carbon-monoxide dehydrogenase small subunit
MIKITLHVNNIAYEADVAPYHTLLETLRDKLGLTDTKVGCGEGECGACTVLVDGKAVLSCLMPAVQADGKKITTIAGLSENGELHPIQRKFIDHDAVQCGYCTPGMVLSAKALLDNNPNPTKEEAKRAILGNICRCTGYQQIVEAIMAAAKERNEI